MKDLTRRQLHAISLAFYDAQSTAFDASRADLPWPGWERLFELLPQSLDAVLDIGCGNGRFAAALAASGRRFDYIGTDASQGLLEAAQTRLGGGGNGGDGNTLPGRVEWRTQDFLASAVPGEDLPSGPFSLVVLMGVLHHVPSEAARLSLLRSAAARVAPGGILALTSWQFAGRARFKKRSVAWDSIGDVLGEAIDLMDLDPGDTLLRFGDDPLAAPRYCHQVSPAEFETWPAELGLETVADYRADGAEGDLNRHWIARKPLGD